MTDQSPSPYSGLIERWTKYLGERSRSRQLDQNEIHGLHIGDEREAVLTADDLRQGIAAIRDLEAENARLREALEPFAAPHAMGDNYVQFAPRLIEKARAALSGRAET